MGFREKISYGSLYSTFSSLRALSKSVYADTIEAITENPEEKLHIRDHVMTTRPFTITRGQRLQAKQRSCLDILFRHFLVAAPDKQVYCLSLQSQGKGRLTWRKLALCN